MLAYKPAAGQQDSGRTRPVVVPPPPPPSTTTSVSPLPPSNSALLCSQSMQFSYLSTGAAAATSTTETTAAGAEHLSSRLVGRTSSNDCTDPPTFPWCSGSDQRHFINNGNRNSGLSLFQQPLTRSNYSPSACSSSPPPPRLFPSPYTPYFVPTASTPTAPRYFFPFPPPLPPPPPPSRHYLQIESYSAILASMGGGGPPPPTNSNHPPPLQPTRPTPIFSVSTNSSEFGLPPPPPPQIVHFSQPNSFALTPPSASPNSSSSVAAATDEVPVILSPCQSPSYRSYPQGSLKHRILVRPESKEHQSPVGGEQPDTKRRRTSPSPSQKSSPPTPVLTRALFSVASSASGIVDAADKSTVDAVQCQRDTTEQQQQQQLQYPAHFMKGAIIQLANGELKCVEDLRTEDFVNSADLSADLRIDSSTVVRIDEHVRDAASTVALTFLVGDQRIQVTVDASLEHPFFVFGQGWSSCCPERTMKRYSLQCHRLQVGDVCISLTHRHGVGGRPNGDQRQPPTPNISNTIATACGNLVTRRGHRQFHKTAAMLSTGSRSMRRKRRWSASDAITGDDVQVTSEQRSVSLADAGCNDCSMGGNLQN